MREQEDSDEEEDWDNEQEIQRHKGSFPGRDVWKLAH